MLEERAKTTSELLGSGLEVQPEPDQESRTTAPAFDPTQSTFLRLLSSILEASPACRTQSKKLQALFAKEDVSLDDFASEVYRAATSRALTNIALKTYSLNRSRELWGYIRAGQARVAEVVLGGGPNSINFIASRASAFPDSYPLMIDRRDSIGGQFSITDLGAWQLNSRNGENLPDDMLALLPGNGRNLNSLGQKTLLQPS